jgi:hemoglobin
MADPQEPLAEVDAEIPPRMRVERQPRLLERIGGREVIEQVVDVFYDHVEADSELRPLFPEDMSKGREKQKWFLEQWLGGEPRYSAAYGHPRLRRRHFPFVIDQRLAGRWLRHMLGALRECGVGEQEIAEVLSDLGPLAKHMINADQPVPREPLGDAFLT